MSIELRLARRYLAHHDLAGVRTEVHPGDEMMRTVAAHAPPERGLARYLRGGHEALQAIDQALDRIGRPRQSIEGLLDFACGCGRVTRFLVDALGAGKVWACDIDAGAVDFVRDTLGARPIYSCADPRQLDLGEQRFDVVFVGSLFTHLPRPTFAGWLEVLVRALRTDGLLLFSTHGVRITPEVAKDPAGFTFVQESETERLDPATYGTTWVTAEVVAELAASAGVADLRALELDLWRFHDLYLARRVRTPELDGYRHTPAVRGIIDTVRRPTPDHAWVNGCVRMPSSVAVREIRVFIDGVDAGAAPLGARVARNALGQLDPEWSQIEWYTEGDVSWLEPGVHELSAVAVLDDGHSECFDVAPLTR